MEYKERLLSGRLGQLCANFPVVVVSGARQVGKSTLVAHVYPEWETVVLDSAIDVGGARADPDLFLDNHAAPLVLDEIQFAPELISAIKRRVDRTRQPGQYILTGSQQWAVLRSASESLAGRAVFLELGGFALSEIAEATTADHWLKRYLDDPAAFVSNRPERLPTVRPLFQQLWRGFLPLTDALAVGLIGDFYRGYLQTYIERDARHFANVDDWQQFGRFVQLVAALTAQEINHSQVGRELGATYMTARRWLATLRATFQWFEVPAYHASTVKRISSKPKGYIADTGLACALQMLSTPQTLAGHPLVGALFETAVVAEIRKLAATLPTPPGFYHWRSHGGGEVDLVLERDGRLYPIEVKLASHPTRNDARGIAAFRATYPSANIAPGLVIAPTETFARLNDADYVLPWDSR